MRKTKAAKHYPAHSLPPTKRHLIRATPLLRGARNRLGAAAVRRVMAELRQWPVPPEAGRLPAVDDMLVARSVWQRGARLTKTPAFGTAAAAYVVCAVIVVGFAPEHVRSDHAPTARDADSEQSNAPRRDANEIQRVAPYRVPGREEPIVAPSAEQIDGEFFTRLQRVVNGFEGQPGQPRPYQPDPIQPVIETAVAPALGPQAPLPPDAIAPPMVGADGQIVEAPPLGAPVPTMPAAVPEAPAVVPQASAIATEAPPAVSQAPVAAPEAPGAAPSSPADAISSGQAPESAVQRPSGPPPGPAA